jgi:hypothetical protein
MALASGSYLLYQYTVSFLLVHIGPGGTKSLKLNGVPNLPSESFQTSGNSALRTSLRLRYHLHISLGTTIDRSQGYM